MKENDSVDIMQSIRPRVLTAYLGGALAFATLIVAWRLTIEDPRPLFALAALLIAAISVVAPRVAVIQFLTALFFQVRLTESPSLLLTDVSAALLILAAVVDFFARPDDNRRAIPIARAWLVLLCAVGLSAVFSYYPSVAISPLARIGLYLLTLLALGRLIPRCGVGMVVRLFFWMTVFHSIVVLIPFVAARGAVRSFGFSPHVFHNFGLVAAPVGVALYAWSRRRTSWRYALGSILVLGGVVATQSRFGLLMTVIMSLVAAVLSIRMQRRVRAQGFAHDFSPKRRLLGVAVALATGIAVILTVTPGFFEMVGERLGQLTSLYTGGTIYLRWILWTTAIGAFIDHPLVGLGPGVFRFVGTIYSTLRLESVYYYIQGLSAHNLFLHYLAETGIVGISAILYLFGMQLRQGHRIWQRRADNHDRALTVALYAAAIVFFTTLFLEASWMWGQPGYVFVVFVACIGTEARRFS